MIGAVCDIDLSRGLDPGHPAALPVVFPPADSEVATVASSPAACQELGLADPSHCIIIEYVATGVGPLAQPWSASPSGVVARRSTQPSARPDLDPEQ